MPSPEILSDALFDTALCLNCKTPLSGPYCAQCGQKKAQRIGRSVAREEVWSRLRWFEWSTVRQALRVLAQPGTVAREYVCGLRKNHLHPLSLLCLAVGVLLLVLGHTQYLQSASPSEVAARAYALVTSYSKWSFSLGAVAVFASTWAVFRRRMGYNLVELVVFALVCQAVFIALQVVNQLPLLLAPTGDSIRWHKRWSPWYMTALQAALFMRALRQFYLLRWPQDVWRLLAAGAFFAVLKWQATALYARAVVEIVWWQMGL